MTNQKHSPAPWGYEYSPWTVRSPGTHGDKQVGDDIPAYEIFDAEGNKVFDTNEDSDAELQEANALLGSTAPRLLAALIVCADLLADYDEAEGEEGDAYREAKAAIAEATMKRLGEATPALLAKTGEPTPFDGYEIHGVTSCGDEQATFYEPVDDAEAEMWTLFGHIPGKGLDAIGDFNTRSHAEEVFARITGRRYSRSDRANKGSTSATRTTAD